MKGKSVRMVFNLKTIFYYRKGDKPPLQTY